MDETRLPEPARLKLELMFDGIRYSEALGGAAAHALPNYYPYRFSPGEPNPTGRDRVPIPYLMTLADGTEVRIKGTGDSGWSVAGERDHGYSLHHDDGRRLPIAFEALPQWMRGRTSDGVPMAQAGVSLHGDMAVVNISPGCEYFLTRRPDGDSMRCAFCAYGAPNERVGHFEQRVGDPGLAPAAVRRMQEALTAALAETPIRHLYLVGGSLTDWAREADRYLELAGAVAAVNPGRVPVSCGSGALPLAKLRELHASGLVDHCCFNLEVWSQPLFGRVCPGKERFVGYARWLESLGQAADLWGPGRVYSAMVAGIELEPEHGMTWEAAADLAVEGAAALCDLGVLPIYSLYWPTGGRDHPDYFSRLRQYFERLSLGYQALRRARGLAIADGFMCYRCAYMQLECDLDRVATAGVSSHV